MTNDLSYNVHSVSKNIPDIFDCNMNKDYAFWGIVIALFRYGRSVTRTSLML